MNKTQRIKFRFLKTKINVVFKEWTAENLFIHFVLVRTVSGNIFAPRHAQTT
jgi:hypothetical protein